MEQRESMVQYKWVGYLSGSWIVVGSNYIKGSRCLLEQETLPSLLSTGWFKEQIRAWFHNTRCRTAKCRAHSLTNYKLNVCLFLNIMVHRLIPWTFVVSNLKILQCIWKLWPRQENPDGQRDACTDTKKAIVATMSSLPQAGLTKN